MLMYPGWGHLNDFLCFALLYFASLRLAFVCPPPGGEGSGGTCRAGLHRLPPWGRVLGERPGLGCTVRPLGGRYWGNLPGPCYTAHPLRGRYWGNLPGPCYTARPFTVQSGPLQPKPF